MSDDPRVRGAAEAAEVLDGLLAAFPEPPRGSSEEPAGARVVALRAAMARSLDVYADLFQATFETYADVAQTVIRPGGTTPAPELVELSGRPGTVATGELWLHNTSRADVHGLRLRLSPLTAHDGAQVVGGTFAPAVVDTEAGGSTAVTVTVALDPQCVPGLYHGVALAEGLPEAALPVRLRVVP